MKKFLKENATLIALVVLAVILGFMDETFFTPRNLSNVVRQVTIVGIIAVGMTLVILIEGIDLSVGSVAGLAAIVITMLMQSGINVWISIILTLLSAGVIIGLWNGFWIAHFKIPAFIITLGMYTIARGLALILCDGGSIPVTDTIFPEIGGETIPRFASAVILSLIFLFMIFTIYSDIKQKQKYKIVTNKKEISSQIGIGIGVIILSFYAFVQYKGIPIPVIIMAAVSATGIFMLKNTRIGRRIYAIGGNEEAARLSGINVKKTKLIVYVLVSVLSALAGIILASRLNGASPNLGTSFELDAIAAVVIGGTSLSGGRGSIGGTIIGAFIIGELNNGMSLLGVSSFLQLGIKGFIIIFAVWFDIMSKNKKS